MIETMPNKLHFVCFVEVKYDEVRNASNVLVLSDGKDIYAFTFNLN
jgi:hypothetical protein